jgi:hypothetical protein
MKSVCIWMTYCNEHKTMTHVQLCIPQSRQCIPESHLCIPQSHLCIPQSHLCIPEWYVHEMLTILLDATASKDGRTAEDICTRTMMRTSNQSWSSRLISIKPFISKCNHIYFVFKKLAKKSIFVSRKMKSPGATDPVTTRCQRTCSQRPWMMTPRW